MATGGSATPDALRLPGRGALEPVRGDEGEAATTYFAAFPLLVRQWRDPLDMSPRSPRLFVAPGSVTG